jgi:hypothetical protein
MFVTKKKEKKGGGGGGGGWVSRLIVFASKTAFMKENEIGLPNQGGAHMTSQ